MSKEEVGDVLRLLDAYYFIYIPSLTIIFGSTNTGIFLSYLLYWHGKGMRKDGWIFKTIDEARLETGLSRFQQDTAIKTLVEYDVLEVQRKESRGRRHFKLDEMLLYRKLDKDMKNYQLLTHSMRIARKQERQFVPLSAVSFLQSLTKDTQQSKRSKKDTNLYRSNLKSSDFYETFGIEKPATPEGDLLS